jgi:hypothetical protein
LPSSCAYDYTHQEHLGLFQGRILMARQDRDAPTKVKQQRSPLNLKTSPELRARIEEAARENELSMTQEVERRLIASFSFEDRLGGSTMLDFFQASASAIKAVEGRTGKRWNEDTATWHAAKAMLEQQFRNWRPTPPNTPGIVAALAHQRKAREALAEALNTYSAKYPPSALGAYVANETTDPLSLLITAGIAAGNRARVPAEVRAKKRVQMTAEWVGVQTLRDELAKADAVVDEAFRQYDEAQKEGEKLAREVLTAIDAAQARDARRTWQGGN